MLNQSHADDNYLYYHLHELTLYNLPKWVINLLVESIKFYADQYELNAGVIFTMFFVPNGKYRLNDAFKLSNINADTIVDLKKSYESGYMLRIDKEASTEYILKYTNSHG